MKEKTNVERESMQKKWTVFDEMKVKRNKKLELLSLFFILTCALLLINSKEVISVITWLHLVFDRAFVYFQLINIL